MGIKHILALTDLSSPSCNGLALAEDIARRLHARVTVGYVHTHLDVLRGFGGNESNACRLREWVRKEDEEHVARLAAKHINGLRMAGIETVETHSAREGVGQLLERVRPDLVCMATRGRTGLKHALLGSVAEHTIRTAWTPALVTRGRSIPHQRPLCVMLGLDMVDEPAPLVRRTARLLGPEDELVLVHVVESTSVSRTQYGSEFALPQPDTPRLEQAVAERLHAIKLPGDGPRLKVAVRNGRPEEALLKLEGELKPHMVVVRTHARRGFDHLMLDSVSERLARRCESPVLVFPKTI